MTSNPVLTQRYEQLCVEPSDIFEHLPTFVKAVEELDAKKVVEIGVRYGVSTIAWLYALEGRGQLWSVDCSWPVAAPGSDVNLLDPQGPLGIVPHWLFLMGYCEWPTVLDAMPAKDVDILFIDANHGYQETLTQLELYFPRMRAGGRIFLHDTALEINGNATEPEPAFPVRCAMEEFCRPNGGRRTLEWSNVDHCSGLGTIYC